MNPTPKFGSQNCVHGNDLGWGTVPATSVPNLNCNQQPLRHLTKTTLALAFKLQVPTGYVPPALGTGALTVPACRCTAHQVCAPGGR